MSCGVACARMWCRGAESHGDVPVSWRLYCQGIFFSNKIHKKHLSTESHGDSSFASVVGHVKHVLQKSPVAKHDTRAK